MVARDFVEFGVEAVFADRSVFVVADDLTHLDDLLQLGDVGVGEVAEDVVADADFERHAEFEDVAERRFVHQQRIDAPFHAAEQRRLAQHHAFLGARDDHAGHLEAAQRFAQHRASDAQRGRKFGFVGDAAARTKSLLLEKADQALLDAVYERGVAVVQFRSFHLYVVVVNIIRISLSFVGA